MPQSRTRLNSPGWFALIMLAILIVVLLLVFSIRRHAGAGPSTGPPPNQHLRH